MLRGSSTYSAVIYNDRLSTPPHPEFAPSPPVPGPSTKHAAFLNLLAVLIAKRTSRASSTHHHISLQEQSESINQKKKIKYEDYISTQTSNHNISNPTRVLESESI
jgi:hypothetical protein